MSVMRLQTLDLPPEERFGSWHDLTLQSHVPMSIDTEHRDDFQATVELLDFGDVQVSRLCYPALRGIRTQRMVRQSDPELLLVSHVPRGRIVSQSGLDEDVNDAGMLLVHHTSLPGSVVNDAPVTNIVLQLPRSALDTYGARADRLLMEPIPTTRGIGAILAFVLEDLAEHAATHPPAVSAQLAATALDLLNAAARASAGSRARQPAESWARIRMAQIRDYVRRRLADPALTPATVADAHGLSIRQLHRVFQAEGDAPSAWIRRQRLEQCRRELIDPMRANLTVAAIGARWGYPDPATFNRAFRREFGLPPGEYRAQFANDEDTPGAGA